MQKNISILCLLILLIFLSCRDQSSDTIQTVTPTASPSITSSSTPHSSPEPNPTTTPVYSDDLSFLNDSGNLTLEIEIQTTPIPLDFAPATSIYIDQASGDDQSGTGSQEAPFQSIKQGLAAAGANTRLIIREGTYQERIEIKSAGQTENPLIIQAFPGESVSISAPDNSSHTVLSITDCSWLHILGINFTGAGNDIAGITDSPVIYINSSQKTMEHLYLKGCTASQGGVGLSLYAKKQISGIQIEDSRFFDNKRDGLTTYANTVGMISNIIVRNCQFYNNSGDSNYTKSHSGSGIIFGQVNKGLIEYCTAYANGAECVTVGGPVGIWAWDSENVVIQYCQAYENRTNSAADGGGFDLDGGCRNSMIQYCYSHNNDGAGYLIAEYGGARSLENCVFRYNISVNDGRKNRYGSLLFWSEGIISQIFIYNNIFYNKISSTVRFLNYQGMSGIYLWNNIFYSDEGESFITGNFSTDNALFQNNIYYTPVNLSFWSGYGNLRDWREATGQEVIDNSKAGFYADPLLPNPGFDDTIDTHNLSELAAHYKPLPASPVIDRGYLFWSEQSKLGYPDFSGEKVSEGLRLDIGAFEQ